MLVVETVVDRVHVVQRIRPVPAHLIVDLDVQVHAFDDERRQAPGHRHGPPEQQEQYRDRYGPVPGGLQHFPPVAFVRQELHGRHVHAVPDQLRVPGHAEQFERGEEYGHGQHEVVHQLVGVVQVIVRAQDQHRHREHAGHNLDRGDDLVRAVPEVFGCVRIDQLIETGHLHQFQIDYVFPMIIVHDCFVHVLTCTLNVKYSRKRNKKKY